MEEAGECEKHKGSMRTHMCETCKTAICIECKAEHDPNHAVYHLHELGQKIIMLLGQENDVSLYHEIAKLDTELNTEVSKLRGWFEGIEKKVVDVVHNCMNDVMNEVLEQTNVKLGKKKKQLEEALMTSEEEKEKVLDVIKDLIAQEQFLEIYKYKDTYYKALDKQRLFMTTGASKAMWIQHIRKIKGISEEFLKENVSNALKHIFTVPIIYILTNKSNQITIYDPATRKRTKHVIEGLVKSKHFDSALIKNMIYIAGGHDEERKILLRNTYEYELLEKVNVLRNKGDLIKGRFGHKMISVTDSFIYALGGIINSFLGTKYTSHCEKYDRVFDRWVEVKPMHENKGYMSACHFKERFIYVFGGFNDDVASECSQTVEFLDTMIESEGWKVVKFVNINKKWSPISQAGVVQLGRQMLLLFGGRTSKNILTNDCYLFNIKDNTMKQLEAKLPHPTCFFQRPIVTYKDELYSFDSTENNLHIFNSVGIKWRMTKKAEWDLDLPAEEIKSEQKSEKTFLLIGVLEQ